MLYLFLSTDIIFPRNNRVGAFFLTKRTGAAAGMHVSEFLLCSLRQAIGHLIFQLIIYIIVGPTRHPMGKKWMGYYLSFPKIISLLPPSLRLIFRPRVA